MAKKKQKPKAAASPPSKLNPAALSIPELATLLSKAGGRKITTKQITLDLEAGAPANADGTLHLVHYTAWLASQVP